MSKTFIILWMIFNHVVADYNLQGWLASAKQKSYWHDNVPYKTYKFYKYDYIPALFMHSISWTFMIMLPLAYMEDFNISKWFVAYFVMNTIGHMIIDHLKANLKLINLWQDQLVHMMQIIFTGLVLLNIN